MYKRQTFGTDFFESSSEIAEAGQAMNGAIYANIAVSEAFSVKYQAAYASDTHLTDASNAYDFALLSASLFSSLGKEKSREDVLNSYLMSQPQNGASGGFRLVKDVEDGAYFSFPVELKQIKDGQVVVP